MKFKKIESYPPLTIDEQETILTWTQRSVHGISTLTTQCTRASMKQHLTSPSLSRKATETGHWL